MQAFQQSVGVFRDAQIPLSEFLADDRIPAAFAHAVDDLVICQHGAQGFAPVDLAMTTISEPVIHQDVLSSALIICLPFCCAEAQGSISRTGMRSIAILLEDVRQG